VNLLERGSWQRAILIAAVSVVSAPAMWAQSGDMHTQPPIILNTAPQDREVFLTWSTLPDALYAVRWRKLGDQNWNTERASLTPYAAIDSLENGSAYQFQLVIEAAGRRYISQIVVQTPRIRDDCGYGTSLFCTQQAFLSHLPRYGIAPSDLRCGGESVNPDLPLPNCRFTAGGVTLALDRAYGSVFFPNDFRPDAESVSQALRRAIWGTENFATTRRENAARVTEVTIPYGGRVKAEARVRSYLVRIAPGLFSRVSWFSMPDHVPGRYAIYHEGHGGAGISDAAELINWLLANGWQVLSLDMPLEGINENDRQYPLYDHEGYARYDRRDSSALRDFFVPLVSVMDMIESDASPKGRPTVMLLGRSGGGWTAYTYAAMDRRVDVAVNIAGGSPFSTLLDSAVFRHVTPHFENHNYLYDQVTPTDAMLAAGRRAVFFFYSQNDPCCYRFSPDNEWVSYLRTLAQGRVGKQYRVFLDDAPIHGLSNRGLDALGNFLTEIGLGAVRVRNATAGEPQAN